MPTDSKPKQLQTRCTIYCYQVYPECNTTLKREWKVRNRGKRGTTNFKGDDRRLFAQINSFKKDRPKQSTSATNQKTVEAYSKLLPLPANIDQDEIQTTIPLDVAALTLRSMQT